MPSLRSTLVLLLVGLAGCDATPADPNPQELVTQVRITFTNTIDATDVVTITASDPDGDGADVTFSPASATLRAGATYSGSITLDDTVNGVSLTDEIRAEAEEHLFAYAFDPSAAATVTLTDRESDYTGEDTNGGDFAVGLTFRVAVAATASGSSEMRAVLYHFDVVPKTSSTSTSDEADLDLPFPVTIVDPMRVTGR